MARGETRRHLVLLAWLNSRLETLGGGRIIITGGFAVEVYTGGVYRTMYIDLVVEGFKAVCIIERFLNHVAERVGRGFLPRDQLLALKSIGIIGVAYDKPTPPVKVEAYGYHVYLKAPEGLVVRYLAAWKYRGSLIGRDEALWVYMAWRDRLDRSQLLRRAREEGVEDKLARLESYAVGLP